MQKLLSSNRINYISWPLTGCPWRAWCPWSNGTSRSRRWVWKPRCSWRSRLQGEFCKKQTSKKKKHNIFVSTLSLTERHFTHPAQGMTGSPGSPGPDGKVGPAVSIYKSFSWLDNKRITSKRIKDNSQQTGVRAQLTCNHRNNLISCSGCSLM